MSLNPTHITLLETRINYDVGLWNKLQCPEQLTTYTIGLYIRLFNMENILFLGFTKLKWYAKVNYKLIS